MKIEMNLVMAKAALDGLKSLGRVRLHYYTFPVYQNVGGFYAGDIQVYVTVEGLKNSVSDKDASNPILTIHGCTGASNQEVITKMEEVIELLKTELEGCL